MSNIADRLRVAARMSSAPKEICQLMEDAANKMENTTMQDYQIKHMVDRFLGWKLPENFNPDNGISFDADAAKKLHPQNHRHEPVGTNLLDAQQAEAMIRYLVEGLPPAPQDALAQ
jgi:hypothetical protein